MFLFVLAAAIEIGSMKQLFIDHKFIESAEGITLTVQQPMQPTVVFSVRVPLGAGPSLSPGATPHLASVETSR